LLFKGYGAKVGLGNMRVKAENRMVTGNFSFVMQIEGSFCLYVRQKNYFKYNSVKLRGVNGKV